MPPTISLKEAVDSLDMGTSAIRAQATRVCKPKRRLAWADDGRRQSYEVFVGNGPGGTAGLTKFERSFKTGGSRKSWVETAPGSGGDPTR